MNPSSLLHAFFLWILQGFTQSRIRPAKVKQILSAIFVLTSCLSLSAQSFSLQYQLVPEDSAAFQKLSLTNAFSSRLQAESYILQVPQLLQAKGYLGASVDSVHYDSASAQVALYIGQLYTWARIRTRRSDDSLLNAVRWPKERFSGLFNFAELRNWQQKLLDHFEDEGHPFGKVYLDSISIGQDSVHALLQIDPGPVYRIDSIRIYGESKIDNEFLQRYLDIPNGSTYNKKKLAAISKKLAEISYVEEERHWDLTMLATGSMLNLYLKPKKSSQANVLFGLQPNTNLASGEKKFLLTVDANVLLRNALGSGETIGLLWQQLQQKSPRLNLLFEQPYIFHSPFGLNFLLEMYKQDSSFLNLNINLGTSYHIDERKTMSVSLQRRQTIISGVNTELVQQTRRLPREADVSSFNLVLAYLFNNTDARLFPRKGNELNLSVSGGTKNIRKNNLILELTDPSDPAFKFASLYDTVKLKAYQLRLVATASHYISTGGSGVLKFSVRGGLYQSANYFRNELFQIGGYKTLRGFDEESQFVSRYLIGTGEYRLGLVGSSYFFGFVDGGWGKHLLEEKKDHVYIGTGLGLSLETKAGIINLAVAVGKRDDTEFNLRQSKVHLGFASYF